MIRDLSTTFWRLCLVLMAASACGPEVAQTDGGAGTTGTSTGEDAGSTGNSSGSSTGTPEPCSRIHEGDLRVDDDIDLASLADLGRVTGDLIIAMDLRDQRDLSFLSCLHTVDLWLLIIDNRLLESTEGADNLRSVKSLSIVGNPNLRVVAGFEQIHGLSALKFDENFALEEIHLDSVKTVDSLQIGYCEGAGGAARHLALADLSGFSGLTTVGRLAIDGNEALMSAAVLDAIEANGAVEPVGIASIRFNPLLSEAVVLAQLDLLGVKNRKVCGNADGDPECSCPIE